MIAIAAMHVRDAVYNFDYFAALTLLVVAGEVYDNREGHPCGLTGVEGVIDVELYAAFNRTP